MEARDLPKLWPNEFVLVGDRVYPVSPPRLPEALFGAWLKSKLSVEAFLKTLN